MIDLDKISEAELIAAYRAKAARYNAIADAIEGKMNSPLYQKVGEAPVRQRRRVRPESQPANPEVVAAVKNALASQKYRAPRLASVLGIPESDIEAVVNDPDSGVEFGTRGWLKLSEEKGLPDFEV